MANAAAFKLETSSQAVLLLISEPCSQRVPVARHVTSESLSPPSRVSPHPCYTPHLQNSSYFTPIGIRSTLSPSRPSSPSRHAPIPIAEHLQIAQTSSADVASTCCLEKPIAPRSTHRPSCLASRPLVWTTSLLGKDFIWARSGLFACVFFISVLPWMFRSPSQHLLFYLRLVPSNVPTPSSLSSSTRSLLRPLPQFSKISPRRHRAGLSPAGP